MYFEEIEEFLVTGKERNGTSQRGQNRLLKSAFQPAGGSRLHRCRVKKVKT